MTDLVTTLRHWVEALRTQQIADTTVADIALFNGGCVSDDIEAAANEIKRLQAIIKDAHEEMISEKGEYHIKSGLGQVMAAVVDEQSVSRKE